MVESKNLLVKQAKANENPQGFQNWNRQMDSTSESMQSRMDDPTQLKSKEFQHNPNQRLVAIQKMADDSPNNKPIIQLKALADRYSQQKHHAFQLKKNNSGLPDSLKSGVENLSGLSMDDVKVHYNSDKPAQLNAHAYAQGTDIHIASGQEKHLPHEAWHVVQQKQGRVQPTTMMKAKVPINDDQGLEKEADVMGARALQMKPFSLSDYRTEKSVQRKGVVQKVGEVEMEEAKKNAEIKENKELDKLDKDLWFKASDGIQTDVRTTKLSLPKHKGITKAFHTTTKELAANNILKRINPKFHNPASRFGGGFYAASDLKTCYAEIAAHEDDQFKEDYELKPGETPQKQSALETIEYEVSGGDLVDCTAGELKNLAHTQPKAIEKKVRQTKRDGIVFKSTKGPGQNIVLFKNYDILKPKSGKPTSAKEGFEKFKKEKISEK